METAEGALEFNLPIIKSNRRLVASENGGLHGPSCLVFNPEWTQKHVVDASKRFQHPALSGILRPKSDEDIAFMSILELGELIRTKQITSHELVQIFLERLKRYDPVLEAVITFTDELAYKQAREVDELIAKGVYLGPLHGIPYGLKDIIAVPGYKTTWGSRSFKDQVLNIEAWVYKRFQTYVKVFLLQSECTLITFFLFYANYRLRSAGAVLVAKLVSGSLAYDDIWFGGRTRNPWNIEEFSTGSSAGPAAGTSAGMVPFAIGSETAGSITFPASRCGVTALRPTFGAVGRTGVMSISESMDKLGAFCRSAADCSVILDVVRGKDPDDLSSRDIAFDDPFSIDITQLTVGYMDDAEMEAQRARRKLIEEVKNSFTVDAFIGNATDWEKVCLGNLVGLPVVVVPTGFKNISNPPSKESRRRTTMNTGIYARPDHDHIALALAIAYQSVTDHHKQRPPIDDLGPNDKIPDPPKVVIPPRRLHP
ncbi:hypothetical protein P3X46_030758 [Hevea brasiliensis]|uniref:Amidase domain-containing protein n=1 Tax=Hevea brasiliensis TaxID=3981 RepID=A0ABQ9KL66_HEVBR|nr:hypothetical protein P3X46_030758 [Hevea brasiliensis]